MQCIGSDNGLATIRRQAIIWTHDVQNISTGPKYINGSMQDCGNSNVLAMEI